MVTIALDNLLSESTVGHYREIKSFPVETEIEAHSEIRNTVTKIGLVKLVHPSVMVDVHKLHVTWLYVSLQHTVTSLNPILYFLIVLEYACCLETIEITDRLTILGTIEFRSIVIQLVGRAMNDTIVVRNLSDLILIVGTVDTDIVTKVFAYLVIPSKIEFSLHRH